MMCFCEIEGKSTLEYINSYVETLLLAKKHPSTTDLHVNDEKKNAIMNLGARKLSPLTSVRSNHHSGGATRHHGEHGIVVHSLDDTILIVVWACEPKLNSATLAEFS